MTLLHLICYHYRLDSSGIVKIGNFGLAEDVYTTGYFRQGKDDTIKLPFKWMAPESLRDGLFNEKTDVVSLQFMHVLRIIGKVYTLTACSGHLVLPAGRYSVLGGSLTLVLML